MNACIVYAQIYIYLDVIDSSNYEKETNVHVIVIEGCTHRDKERER